MDAVDESIRPLKWTQLSGQERYRVVMLARKGEMEVSQLCKTFGVSRQTLYRAMEAADQAAMEALEPKKPGRKPVPMLESRARELTSSNDQLQKELAHWQMKYEVAKTFIDLERQLDHDTLGKNPGEKKRRKRRKRTS
jgi:transposase-like protein